MHNQPCWKQRPIKQQVSSSIRLSLGWRKGHERQRKTRNGGGRTTGIRDPRGPILRTPKPLQAKVSRAAFGAASIRRRRRSATQHSRATKSNWREFVPSARPSLLSFHRRKGVLRGGSPRRLLVPLLRLLLLRRRRPRPPCPTKTPSRRRLTKRKKKRRQ